MQSTEQVQLQERQVHGNRPYLGMSPGMPHSSTMQ
jgi:hypothetical protein